MGEGISQEEQERLNVGLENLLENIRPAEIEFARNYIEHFGNEGYDVRYFQMKVELIKREMHIMDNVKGDLIGSIKYELIDN